MADGLITHTMIIANTMDSMAATNLAHMTSLRNTFLRRIILMTSSASHAFTLKGFSQSTALPTLHFPIISCHPFQYIPASDSANPQTAILVVFADTKCCRPRPFLTITEVQHLILLGYSLA
jgi:hypothetical protein